ncbi:hypothetical protein MKK70_25295 [Methylobacterium sp. E-041]|uniref:hypothetical protein n=1 Tax=Methylobacterium sp. E-041 TaxID=2836573 RepID=UPI001FBAB2E1|nr:hypothetical protein [Methylobacterium sp. E-041]MCJ2108628.1 hypothetical protein [Methylobacterium sp. E-041]
MYWSHTLEDLIRLTDLKIQFEMVKAMSFTESLLFTAGQVFGSNQSKPTEDLNSVSDMLAFAAQING